VACHPPVCHQHAIERSELFQSLGKSLDVHRHCYCRHSVVKSGSEGIALNAVVQYDKATVSLYGLKREGLCERLSAKAWIEPMRELNGTGYRVIVDRNTKYHDYISWYWLRPWCCRFYQAEITKWNK
jgi:hypothetical protein